MAEFIEQLICNDWEVETDTGWEDIKGIGKTIEYEEWVVDLGDLELICADDHILFMIRNDRLVEIYAKDLGIGDIVQTKYGPKPIWNLYKNGKSSNMYDLQLEEGNRRYYTNDILSHNSVFLWNIAYNMWYYGANVLGVSLEMSSHKIAKRIGANAFGVDIGSYAKFSENELQFNEAVKRFKGEQNDGMGFNMNGSMRLKRYGSANVDDIYKLVKRIEDRHGYKLNALVLDYATELQNSSGLAGDKTYSYHKENTNELYALGVEENIAVITGHQLHVRYKGMEDVSLQMAAESTGITQRPDLIYGLIQSPNMRVDKKFACKLLKGRDTGDVEYRTEFGIDWKHMRLTPYDNMIDPAVV